MSFPSFKTHENGYVKPLWGCIVAGEEASSTVPGEIVIWAPEMPHYAFRPNGEILMYYDMRNPNLMYMKFTNKESCDWMQKELRTHLHKESNGYYPDYESWARSFREYGEVEASPNMPNMVALAIYAKECITRACKVANSEL